MTAWRVMPRRAASALSDVTLQTGKSTLTRLILEAVPVAPQHLGVGEVDPMLGQVRRRRGGVELESHSTIVPETVWKGNILLGQHRGYRGCWHAHGGA